jgi:maltooligosyltrehalose trehalohydrolase
MLGERLTELLSYEQLKLAAGTVLLSPYQPMIFMGEEYAEPARFQYFISHLDPALIEAVRRGRVEEFRAFRWQGGQPPNPQSEETFERCKLDHALRGEGHHRVMRDFYQALIALRKNEPPLAYADRARMETISLQPNQVMAVRRWSTGREICVVLNYSAQAANVSLPLPAGTWKKLLDSSDPRWRGGGGALPDTLESHGRCACQVAAHSLAVIAK